MFQLTLLHCLDGFRSNRIFALLENFSLAVKKEVTLSQVFLHKAIWVLLLPSFIQWPGKGEIILSIFSQDNINSFSFLFHSKIKIRGNYSNHSSQDNINLSIFPSKSANKEPPQTLFHNIVSIPFIFKNKRITIFLPDNTKFLTSLFSKCKYMKINSAVVYDTLASQPFPIHP